MAVVEEAAMAGRFGTRGRWAVVLAALVVLVVGTGLVVVLRATSQRSGPPSAGPGTSSAAPTTSASTVPSEPAPSTPALAPPSTVAPVPLPAGLAGQDVTVLPTDRRVVALTFDAGANAAGLPSILRTLSEQGVPTTFFLTGQWVAADPGRVAALRTAGYRIGNHSATHPNFTALSDAQIRTEVLDAEQTIRAAGADPRPLFRFPSGDRDARTIADVNELGYVAVRWTVDTLGWKGTSGGMTAAAVADRALGSLRPGEIVLMHVGSNPDDGTTLDADALPTVISRMRASGYGFVTLDALLG